MYSVFWESHMYVDVLQDAGDNNNHGGYGKAYSNSIEASLGIACALIIRMISNNRVGSCRECIIARTVRFCDFRAHIESKKSKGVDVGAGSSNGITIDHDMKSFVGTGVLIVIANIAFMVCAFWFRYLDAVTF